MHDLADIVVAAQSGDFEAFSTLVRRYQDLAFGAAFVRLADPHLAQDVAQEAFLQAYRDLATLREPKAFPHWLRRIVAKHTDRAVRRKRLQTVPLDTALLARDEQAEPSRLVEARELTNLVQAEIARLPERERVAVTLFYLADRSQTDIAAFLEVPTSTIKKRLFDARRRLKERMMSQLGDHLHEYRPSQDERFTRRVQFLIAIRTGDMESVERHLQANPGLVHATLSREDWGRAEMGRPTLPIEFEYTPLHFAATYGQLELAELLLAHGANVDDSTPGEAPLSRAVLMHDLPMIELLLRHGADPNRESVAGLSPLHRAAMRGRPEVVRALLAHGADAGARDRSGRTARDWAMLGGATEVLEMLDGKWSSTLVDHPPTIGVPTLSGRVLDPKGNPLDGLGSVPTIDRRPAGSAPTTPAGGPLLETGVKVLDLLAPLPRGGTIRMSAQGGVGIMVLLSELSLRLARRGGRTVYVRWQERFYRVEDAMRELRDLGTDDATTIVLGRLRDSIQGRERAVLTGLELAESFRDEGRDVLLLVDAPPSGELPLDSARPRVGVRGGSITLVVFDLLLPNTGLELPTLQPTAWDARIAFDVALAKSGVYPAVDGVESTSRLLSDGLVSREHASIAARVREILRQDRADASDKILSARARQLRQFQSQPFFVAQPWTARPGEAVALEDTLSGYGTIAAGGVEGLSDDDLLYVGRLPRRSG